MNVSAQAKPGQIFVFSGADEYLLVQDGKNLVNRLMPPEEQTLGLEIIEGRARNATEAGASIVRCIEALRTAGFMGGRKVVWLRAVNFLDRGLIARSKEVSELLATLAGLIAGGLPKGNIFVLTANVFDKASALFKACNAQGTISQQEELKPWQKEKAAANFTRELLQKNKLQAAPETIAAIVELAGTDSRQLAQEVGKLATFVHPGQQVGKDDVTEIISATREGEAIHFADAVGYRELPRALALLRQLFFQKENPISLIIALGNRFRYLLILDLAAGENAEQLAALLASDKGRPMHPYFLGKLKEQARLYSRAELAEGQEAILETHLKLVSSNGLEKILLEKLLVKLCGRNPDISRVSRKISA